MAHPDGWIFWYNHRWYDYTGTTPEQMEGWGWQSVHDPNELEEVMERWQSSVRSGEPFDMTFPLKGADGIFRPFLTRVMPFRDENDNIVLWFGTNTDVSEQQQMMKQRDELLASERAARAEAERAGRLKDEFLATLSHELRTPLNAILGWTSLMRSGTMKQEELQQGLETIERNARVQTQLIEDLLDMSRIISGKLRLDVHSLQPSSFIDSAIETVMPAAAAKGIHIEKDLDPYTGPIIGDADRLQQVVWNLLSNAIKFTPQNGVVRVMLRRTDSHLEIRVADTGQGIAANFLPHVFDRFRQADSSTTRKHTGLGLGLGIVKQLVEFHGGTVSVTSPGENQGATFTVQLPLQPPHELADDDEPPQSRLPHVTSVDQTGVDLSGIKILVVDDEPDARDVMKRLLENCGAEVMVAMSATEGLHVIKTERPDVLVSDIGMADIDGYEFLRRVRALGAENGGMLPAIALTAFARSEDRNHAFNAGYLAHVSKPAERGELLAAITSVAAQTTDAHSDKEQ